MKILPIGALGWGVWTRFDPTYDPEFQAQAVLRVKSAMEGAKREGKCSLRDDSKYLLFIYTGPLQYLFFYFRVACFYQIFKSI